MSSQTVRFLFDYNSPYSYIASLLVEDVCARHGAEVLWEPIVLGGIFKAFGTTPGFMIEHRNTYMRHDLERICEVEGLPYKERTQFLFNPILAMRATLQVPQGAEQAKVVHSLFGGAFALDQDLGDPQVVRELLDAAGCDGAALIEGAQQQSVKDTLKKHTDDAIASGVFGAPTMILQDGAMFWGHDRLKVLDFFLEKTKNS